MEGILYGSLKMSPHAHVRIYRAHTVTTWSDSKHVYVYACICMNILEGNLNFGGKLLEGNFWRERHC
jgi:hypothetical protein